MIEDLGFGQFGFGIFAEVELETFLVVPLIDGLGVGIGNFALTQSIEIVVQDAATLPLRLAIDSYFSELYEGGQAEGDFACVMARSPASAPCWTMASLFSSNRWRPRAKAAP